MGIIKQHTIDDFDKKQNGVDKIFIDHKKARNNKSFKRYKKIIFRLAILTGMILIFCFYYFADSSKVKAISVINNYYLDQDYIKSISKISLESRYHLIIDQYVEYVIKKDPMIKDVKVTHENNGVILIDVIEYEPYGYRYDDIAQIMLKGDKVIELTSDYMDIISLVPLITGFKDESSQHLLSNAFENVDRNMIESISEIEQYALSYDNNCLKVLMNDGNYFITSYYGLDLINDYNEIASNLVETGVCIYADENNSVAYKSECPWNQTASNLEYWYDENGEPILNKYGDHMVKHYYTDDKGNYILDENGNKIVIPLNEFNEELPNDYQTESSQN